MASGDNGNNIHSLIWDVYNETADDSPVSYGQACSFLTVQSDSKGFFRLFYMNVRELFMKNGWLEAFGKLETNRERIMHLFSADGISQEVLKFLSNVEPIFKQKCEKKSKEFRLEAERLFVDRDTSTPMGLEKLKKALNLANIAVLRAPTKGDYGNSLVIALMSRASILLALDNGVGAINDFKFVADLNPDTKRTAEYYAVLSKCYIYMNDYKRAEISLKLAESFGKECVVDLQFCREKLQIYRTTGKKARDDVAPAPAKFPELPKLCGGEHNEWKGASKYLMLSSDYRKGRFMVAGKTFSAGDVVLCEEPLAACLNHSSFGGYCYHCFVKLVVTIPCMDCAGVAFCSVECMRAACETYHRYECKFMDLLIGSGMSVLCFIALKIFTQSSNVKEALRASGSICNTLCKHLDERSVDDHLQRSLMATFLMRCLQKSGYFGQRSSNSPEPTDIEMRACINLYGLLQVLQHNSHEIYYTDHTRGHIFDDSKIVYIGAGIYRTGALFNHECWPSVARQFIGSRLILTALKPHAPGEVVAENYGPVFTKMDLKQRKETLRTRYLFDCDCLPCIRKWPFLEKFDSSIRWRCSTANCLNTLKLGKSNQDVRPTCDACRKKLDFTTNFIIMNKVEQWYMEAAEYMVLQNVQRATELFTAALNSFFEIAVLPHKGTMIAQLSYLKCLAASKMLKKN